jgi:hypothetical protein
VIAHLLAWKVIPSVAPQIPVFFFSLFPFLHQAFQVRPFCSICMKWVVLLWTLCCLLAYNFSGWRWTKCHSAYLLPFSLAYIIMFNLKPTVYEIAVCSVHILSGEKIFTHFHFVPLGNAYYWATGVRNGETLSCCKNESLLPSRKCRNHNCFKVILTTLGHENIRKLYALISRKRCFL